MQNVAILTHRGLDPDKSDYPLESSFEAFESHLRAGFGIEFDVRPTQDNQFVVLHDATLARLTSGQDTREVAQIPLVELTKQRFSSGRLADLKEILTLIDRHAVTMCALHLKSAVQKPEILLELIAILRTFPAISEKLLVFDVTFDSAALLRAHLPGVKLAPSVAHPFDIERFNECVGHTLYTADAILKHGNFKWVWLDEWDTLSHDGTKRFYTPELFALLREHGISIALVTPELHRGSPGLLGSESHADAASRALLMDRIRDILSLKPDAICTDHPDAVRALMHGHA